MKKIIVLLTSLATFSSSFACTTIIVGKKASATGDIIIARNSDSSKAVNSKHLVIHQATFNKDNVYHSSQNNFKYTLSDIDAISATESVKNNPEALKFDPYNKKSGISESDITTIVMSKARTAKQGIQIIGNIIEKQGAAEGFGIAIADANEVWYLETGAGNIWAAAKVPDDKYFVSANQVRLQNIDLNDSNNFLGSKNLITFATDHDLINKDNKFDFRTAYAKRTPNDITYNYLRVWTVQNMYNPSSKYDYKLGNSPAFMTPEHKISVANVKEALKNHYQNTKNDPYDSKEKEAFRPISVFRESNSHITLVRNKGLPSEISNVLYISLGMNSLSAYVPFYVGMNKVPDTYAKGSDQATDDSAFWAFRKVQTLAMLDFKKYAPIVQEGYEKLSAKIEKKRLKMEAKYIAEHKKSDIFADRILQEFINWETREAVNTAHKLENKLMTLETKRINQKYLFEGA